MLHVMMQLMYWAWTYGDPLSGGAKYVVLHFLLVFWDQTPHSGTGGGGVRGNKNVFEIMSP